MRILVTGATGSVGTSSVIGVARRHPDWAPPKTTWVRADLHVDDITEHLVGIDAVVHLAWLIQPSHRPLTTWRTNIIGTERLLAAAADAAVPTVVDASSVGVERVLDRFEDRHPSCRVSGCAHGFVFQRAKAAQQRRLFIGSWLSPALARPRPLPLVPDVAGLRLQALDAADAAEA